MPVRLERLAVALAVALCASPALAEGVGSAPAGASTDRKVVGVGTLMFYDGGLVAMGATELRRLPKGARRWETIHAIPGDSLYRAVVDPSGRLLDSWEKDPLIRYFSADGKPLATFPKPPSPPELFVPYFASLDFLAGGRDALVYVSGRMPARSQGFNGSAWVTAAYRIPLDGGSGPQLLFRCDDGFRLHVSRQGAVFAVNRHPGRKCDHGECLVASIVAYELAEHGVRQRTLLDASALTIGRARLMRGSDPDGGALLLDDWKPRQMGVLRWRYGEERVDYRTYPWPPREELTTFALSRAGAILEVRGSEGALEVWRHAAEGSERLAALRALQQVDAAQHGLFERPDGSLWIHWGDHLAILAPGKPPRAYDLGHLLPRRSDWGGDVYLKGTDQLWVGIDGRGRDYERVDLAEAERRARPWPAPAAPAPPPPAAAAKPPPDPSTDRRLYGASALRPYAGGLVSVGGGALRRLPAGAKRWEAVHFIPEDSLYRVAADDAGRFLAAWEKDPFVHFFDPAKGLHVALPKPAAPPEVVILHNVERLDFLPGGREALVYMTGNLDRGTRRSTAAYRIALDGRSEPRLLFRVDDAVAIHLARRGAVFLLPRDPGKQECSHRTCWPVASIVAHELTPEGVRVRTLLDGARLDVSSAEWVPGSGDEQVALVLRLVALRDRQRLNGGRAILRWRWGPDAAEVRSIAGNGSFSPAWLLTSQGVFIEAENRSAPVETLELRSYPPGDGAMEATTLTAPRRQSGPHGFGERRDGSLWLHWGDRLALLGPGKPPRRLDLEPLLERGTEWADAAVYVAEPESIWFGLDGRQRGYSRVDLAEAERRSSEWR